VAILRRARSAKRSSSRSAISRALSDRARAAVDNTADVIRCGSDVGGDDVDTLTRDLRDVDATGCEIVNGVGTLALAAKGANVKLSWSHPRSWRQLRSVTLRLRGAGKVVIRPRAGSIKASGKVAVARGKLTRNGRTVTARLKLHVPAGKRLVADVIAVDVRGNRQVERRAAIVKS